MTLESEARAVAEDQRTTPGLPWTVTDGVYIAGFANGAVWAVSRITPEQVAATLHGDQCPEDPEPGELCSCDGGYFDRMGEIVTRLYRGEAGA